MVLTVPPRHGKSEYISKHCPPWTIGKHPDWPVILVSHSFEFARTWGRKAKEVFEENGKYFGHSVATTAASAHDWIVDGHSGGMYCAGIGGPIIGRGAKLIILDDTVKDAEAANSEVQRESAWEWYLSTLRTRLEPGGGIIAMFSRWHEDDLIGRILTQSKETGEKWDVINIPAFANENDPIGRRPGEVLWPDRFDKEYLELEKKIKGSYWWSAMYQGSPQPAEGARFKRHWLRYYQREGELYCLYGGPEHPSKRYVAIAHCRVFVTVDLAFTEKKENDYFACAAWAVTRQHDLLMLDMHRERLEGPDILRAIIAMMEKWKAQYAGIEATQAQLLVVQLLRQKSYTIRALTADKDKLSRAIPAITRMEAGQIYIPGNQPYWLGDFIDELLAFNKGAHDDQVDNLAYAAIEVQRFGGAPEPESHDKLREVVEREVAVEFWNRADQAWMWSGDEGGD